VPEGNFHLFHNEKLDYKVDNHQQSHENDEKSNQKIEIQRRHYLINYLGVVSSESILEAKCVSIHKLHHLFQTNLRLDEVFSPLITYLRRHESNR
jgi:hypothetical protein